MTRQPLTDRQQEVLDFIVRFHKKNHFAPTVREMAGKFQVNINATVGILHHLRDKGYITWQPGMSRTITVV